MMVGDLTEGFANNDSVCVESTSQAKTLVPGRQVRPILAQFWRFLARSKIIRYFECV